MKSPSLLSGPKIRKPTLRLLKIEKGYGNYFLEEDDAIN